jgi:LysM repeat protein
MNYVKSIAPVIVCFLCLQYVTGQTNYITHTLKQGESLSALAQQYHTTVGDIMRINGMHTGSKLVYGSKIKIPTTQKQAEVAKKSGNKAATTAPPATSGNEITHVVMKGETLYSISKKYNISVEQIKTWNHLTDDNAKVGTLLIISENGSNKLSAATAQKQTAPAVTVPEEKKEPVVETKPEASTETVNKTDTPQPAPQTENNINNAVTSQPNDNYSGEGFFAPEFKERKSKNMQSISGISKTFKTASGWSDGKYYILADNIQPGTIVKVTADNGNSVFAKVLWNMGEMKENAGINFRVSNATAAALHENNDSFNLNVSF